jgi:hypothetical protein
MTAICMDESVFVYDSAVRKVWAKKGSKPRIMTTGSHKKIFEFGSVVLDGSTLFRGHLFPFFIISHPTTISPKDLSGLYRIRSCPGIVPSSKVEPFDIQFIHRSGFCIPDV